MARRALAGRDQKILQGHRRDEFFARMRRRGGVARLPNQAPEAASIVEEEQPSVTEGAEALDEAPSPEASAAVATVETEAATEVLASEEDEAAEQATASTDTETSDEASGGKTLRNR